MDSSSLAGRRLVIATRESRLALWQARHVQALLQARFGPIGVTVELLGMTTRGDQILDRTLSKVGGKGLFVKELEVAMAEGRADHRPEHGAEAADQRDQHDLDAVGFEGLVYERLAGERHELRHLGGAVRTRQALVPVPPAPTRRSSHVTR